MKPAATLLAACAGSAALAASWDAAHVLSAVADVPALLFGPASSSAPAADRLEARSMAVVDAQARSMAIVDDERRTAAPDVQARASVSPDLPARSAAAVDWHALLFGRADASSSSSSAQSTSPASSSSASSDASASSTDSASNSDSTDSASSSGSSSSGSAKTTASSSGTAKGSSKASSNSSTTFDPRLPAGGISMITPQALAGSQFYKIGDWVTFAWNYTSLSVTPSAIDVLASCSANQGTYTLALNQSVEPTQKVLWDTSANQSGPPLLTETYTLIIYDSNSSVSATAAAGYLGTYENFRFGMYTPQPYTPWADFVCPTCKSPALSAYERSALKVIAYTLATTFVSFSVCAYNFLW